MSREIKICDTTLRDGTQSGGVSLSMEDKVRIASGSTPSACWPGSNLKDLPFFKRAPDAVFRTAKISAFGATERPGVPPRDDANIQALVEAGPPVVTIFGNAWDFHVTSALGWGGQSRRSGRRPRSRASLISVVAGPSNASRSNRPRR